MKLSAAMALAAMASTATAQISNTVYFDKYNYRQHHLNPAMMPDQRFYLSVIGNVAMDLGNKSLTFSDVVKNVDGKTVLFLDKTLNTDAGNGKKGKGQQEFLDALGDNLSLYSNLYVDVFDFGFWMGDKSFLGFSVGLQVGVNTQIPSSIFDVVLDGMEKNEKFNLDASSLNIDAYAYTEGGITFAHQFGEKLTLGLTGKYLWGGTCLQTDFNDIKITGSIDEWVLSGNAEIMASYPGLVAKTNEEGKLRVETENDDVKWQDFKGNKGFALDFGGTYKLTKRLTLAASIKDLGFINYSKNVARIRMQKDFHYVGAEFTQDNTRDEHNVRQSGELNFKKYESEFEETFTPNGTAKFKQKLNTKIYAGASYDLCKILSVGILSKTTLADGKTWQEFSASANLHLLRMLSINGIYSMMNGKWNALGAGANINLGPINVFAAVDNIPLHYGKDKKDGYTFPDKLTSVRYNIGLGLVIGSKERKDKRKAKEEEEERNKSILDDSWRNGPEADFVDSDGDGVEDATDKCPNTEAGAPVDEEGCPLDTDGDGVPDYLDQCPDTPYGANVDENGCALDSDNDGVNDINDRCPGTPSGVAVDSHGCPLDTDGDGVADYLDKCADTPNNTKVDATGCPIDSDNDGVPDYLDNCPDVAGVAENNGCPEIKQEVKQVFQKALNSIEFETNKSKIVKSSYPILDEIVQIMKDNPSYKLFIKGHTDNEGNSDKNLKLSQDRAAAVLDYLSDKGVSESRMRSAGFGDTRPIVPNNSPENKAKNRRVEFEIEF